MHNGHHLHHPDQEDRHICTIVGGAISYFYTAAAVLVVVEAHACFKVIERMVDYGGNSAEIIDLFTLLAIHHCHHCHRHYHDDDDDRLQAITGGIVGGRARVYLPTAWG